MTYTPFCVYITYMPGAKGILVLEDNDWKECQRVVRSRNRAAGMTRRAQMLLMAAQGFPNRRIALKLGVNAHVVGRVRRDYGERGLAVLSDRHRSGRPRSSRNEQIVRKVVERVCQAPAKGLSRWSVRTLAQHLKMPFATVGRILREQKLYPHRLRTFTFSPDPQFGEKLLEVVALYMNPPQQNGVVLCMDEKSGIQAGSDPTYVTLARSKNSEAQGEWNLSAFVLALTFSILLSSYYPWYYSWLAMFLCFVPNSAALALTLIAWPLYRSLFDQTADDLFRFQSRVFLPFFALLVLGWIMRIRRSRATAND